MSRCWCRAAISRSRADCIPSSIKRVGKLLGLVEQQNGLVGDLFLRVCLSSLQLALSCCSSP